MGKKNVIRSDASVTVVRIICYMGVIIGILLLGYGIYTAVDAGLPFNEVIYSSMILTGIGVIVTACFFLMITNIADDLKTLRVNEYGIQKKTQEFRNEVLTRMHNLEQENLHLIQEQQKLVERLEEIGEKSGAKMVRRNGRTGVRVSETPKEEETDYELDLH